MAMPGQVQTPISGRADAGVWNFMIMDSVVFELGQKIVVIQSGSVIDDDDFIIGRNIGESAFQRPSEKPWPIMCGNDDAKIDHDSRIMP